uniref:Mitochondrial import inner membrane translocase subunit Tim10 B n=1 Tax=Nothobranchius kuhntae TaxID=321403 RepID=A0A1A8KP88_NOTKU
MDPDQQLRNLRDFLLVYNRMTEICFQRCSSNFNYRNLTMDEERCVDSCAGKLIRSNHRLMGTYVQLMPKMVQRRMEEMESKAAENAAAAAVTTSSSEASPAFQASIDSPPPPDLPPSGTRVVSEVQSSALKSAGLEILADTTATEAKLSATAPLTPSSETDGTVAGLLQSSIPGFQTDSGGSKVTSLSVKESTSASIESKTGKA